MNRLCLVVYIFVNVFAFACADPVNSNVPAAANQTGAQQGGGIASTPTPTPHPSPSETPEPSSRDEAKGPADVIYEYYASINSRDYRSAYELWSGNGEASKKTFDQFRDGFADTERTEVIIGTVGREEGAAGSRYITIPVTIKARTTDGKDQAFKGEYVLRRSVVDGATDEQRSWRIYSAKIRKS